MLCEFCEKPINSMPYNCKFCGSIFCGEHRLPEAHKCSNLNIPSDGKWFKPYENSEQKISDLEKENVRLQGILLGRIESTMGRKEALDK
ncbi:MAG: zinc finger AN1 domain-containing stress-associated protein, partial [Candidatus Methanoperedens sp.]